MADDGYPGNATWFDDHYLTAPREIADFLAGDGLSMKGKRVADVGTGDGIIALGLCHLVEPEFLVGYDIEATDRMHLSHLAQEHGIEQLPDNLRFEQSFEDHIPAATGAFDFIVSWSAFEHISEPVAMAREIRRLLAPGGIAMIQLFPFYRSEHGDHSWTRPSFEHLISGKDGTHYYLNHITFEGLHQALKDAALRVVKLELIHYPFHVPAGLEDIPLIDLAVGGVKLLAVPVPDEILTVEPTNG